jgi:hypothetical protein
MFICITLRSHLNSCNRFQICIFPKILSFLLDAQTTLECFRGGLPFAALLISVWTYGHLHPQCLRILEDCQHRDRNIHLTFHCSSRGNKSISIISPTLTNACLLLRFSNVYTDVRVRLFSRGHCWTSDKQREPTLRYIHSFGSRVEPALKWSTWLFPHSSKESRGFERHSDDSFVLTSNSSFTKELNIHTSSVVGLEGSASQQIMGLSWSSRRIVYSGSSSTVAAI